MYFKRVEVIQFRNLTSTTLAPSPSLNLISGQNGSGKSSLLEAINYLATGSSFLTSRLSNAIQHEKECFTLFCESGNEVTHKVGIQRCRNLKHTTRINGQDIVRRSDLVQLLPLQVISPDSISLLTDGSENRRNFLDWALFHVEQSFHHYISHYQRALKQRNALLKLDELSGLSDWDMQLIEHGLMIDEMRRTYLSSIEENINEFIGILLPELSVELRYRSGWAKDTSFEEALKSARDTDRKLRHTTVGPHRGDISIRSKGFRVSDTLSRGQLKLVVIAMKLAQIVALHKESGKKPIILLDDMASELDQEHRLILLKTVKSLGTQVFITTPDINQIECSDWRESKVFHVEHGVVKEVL